MFGVRIWVRQKETSCYCFLCWCWAFYWCNLVFISALCEVVCSVFLLRLYEWTLLILPSHWHFYLEAVVTFNTCSHRRLHGSRLCNSMAELSSLSRKKVMNPIIRGNMSLCVYLCVFVKRLHRGCICSRGSNGTGIKVSHLSLPACLEACTVLDSVWE